MLGHLSCSRLHLDISCSSDRHMYIPDWHEHLIIACMFKGRLRLLPEPVQCMCLKLKAEHEPLIHAT